MSMPGLQAFHMGLVVYDVDAAAALYGRMLGVPRWRRTEFHFKPPSWQPHMTESLFRVAYGRAAGQTIELLQSMHGRSHFSDFLEEHGEGVQHVGFWCPDMRAAVEAAVAEGAEILGATVDDTRQAIVQLRPGSNASDIITALDPNGSAHLRLPMGSVHLELLGPNAGRDSGLRQFLDEQYKLDPAPLPIV
jgi:catechol 2,3-dioxygenase-like lactoylglutathione lyase family enzyme